MFLQRLAALVTAAVSALVGVPADAVPPRPAAAEAGAASAAGRPQGCPSYWVVADDGGVFTAGPAPFAGSGAGTLGSPAVGMAGTPSGRGYWLAGADGAVAAFGDARHHGDAAGTDGVVGLAARPQGDGYWLVTGTGRVLAFGAAPDVGASVPAGGVVAIAATPRGRGYWLATAGGGVHAFGDARLLGTAEGRSAAPIVAMAASPNGAGYWLAAADGAVFAFGDARFHGRAALPRPVRGMAASPTGGGYWLAAADGRIAAFGDAKAAAPVRYPTMVTQVVGLAVPRRNRPCPVAEQGRKVLFLGDSVMFDVAAGLEPALLRVPGVAVASRPWFAYGLELSRDVYDWREQWRQILAAESPDVVVVLAGFGDLWAPRLAPAEQRPETPEFRARYGRIVDEALRMLTAGGAAVVWIGLPWVADTNIYFPDVRARVASVNQVFREAMARNRRATFVDAAGLLSGLDGGYAFSVVEGARAIQLRKPDGLHLCPPGVERVARAAGDLVVRTFGERLRPGWEQGTWRDDIRFHQGPALDCK